MSDEQKTLIEIDGEEVATTPSKKRISDKNKAVKNSEIRDALDQVVDSNNEIKACFEQIQMAFESLQRGNDEVISANRDVKESQGRLAADLIETMEKIENLSNSTDMLSNRLDEIQMTAFTSEEPKAETKEEKPAERPAEEPAEQYVSVEGTTGFREGPAPPELDAALKDPKLEDFITTKEVFNVYLKQLSRRDGELGNKKLMTIMEKLCLIREDYAKLCNDMGRNIASLTAKDILSSFEAYLVDLENMISDAGISVGPYGKDGDQVDVMHQRIVGVVPTTDPSKNGTVAERLSSGYEYDGRALLKEKVNVYKVAEPAPAQSQTGFRLSPDQ
ncbi:MAG: hypothetical protein MJZ38_01970 [archaeon]|nr:hypothetical protein [archaeon]